MLELKLAQSRHCRSGKKEVETKAKVLFSFPRLNISRPTIAHLRYKHTSIHLSQRTNLYAKKHSKNKFCFQFEATKYELEKNIIQRFFF